MYTYSANQNNKRKILHLLFCFIFFSVSFFSTQNSYATATDYGVGRTRSCDGNGNPDGLQWDDGGDVSNPGKSPDIQFVLSNPVCLTVIATTYAMVISGIAAMNGACGTGSPVPRLTPSPILDTVDLAKAGYTCGKTPTAQCCAGFIGAGIAVGAAFAELNLIYNIAKKVYSNTRICGSNWTKPDPTSYNISAADYKQTLQLKIEDYIDSDSSTSMTLDNQTYREWYYDGVEVEDNPDSGDICLDPTGKTSVDPTGKTSSSYPPQKYYLQGLQAGNYNCEKYHILSGENDPATGDTITTDRLATFNTAYNCCKNRSQNYICLEAGYYEAGKGNIAGSGDDNTSTSTARVFCKAGSRCAIEDITFSTKFLDNDRIICAETYSLCPYNFTVSGGSEYCDYYQDGIWSDSEKRWVLISQDTIDSGNCSGASEIRNADCTYNNKANKCKNYCQYLTHCTIVSGSTYAYESGISSPYFSDACINFVGDSLNRTSYGTGFILGSQRHFSAPIAQCVKETMENLFYNKAGHSRCLNVNEAPSSDGTCPSGDYIIDENFTYKKGNIAKTESFFSSLQRIMENIVKLILTLAVMFYGINLLILKNDVRNKKDILVFILKIGMIFYFATGDAWQSMFFKGVYGASAEFSRMIFKIQVNDDEKKRDGCQFGNISLSDGSEITVTYDNSTYPSGKEYLAIWDTLDCKIARYLGFGPEVTKANIASLILAGFFTGSIGIYFSFSIMFFGLMLIAATFRALHIFLSSCMAIIIFVFVSPLIITAALFKKTEDIFKGWLKNLISFCFQPIILTAYISIFIIIFDKTLVGSAKFHGVAPNKTISCNKYCEDANGNYLSNKNYACDQTGETVVNPMNDSIACMISINSFSSWPGLQMIGVSIPILINVFSGNVKVKIFTLLKGALVMYLLFKFMDEISGIASRLIGGEALPGASGTMSNATAMFSNLTGFLKGVQKRTTRAAKKFGKKGVNAARDKIREMTSSGKEVSKAGGDRGGDSVGEPSQNPTQNPAQNPAQNPDSGSDSTGNKT